MSPRLIAWLVLLPLAAAGTQVAHTLAYRLVTPSAGQRVHELSSSGHGYLEYLPLALAIGAVVVVFALVAEIRQIVAAPHAEGCRPRAWTYAVVAPAIFVFQEHFERLFHDGVFPWDAALSPSLAAGLLLQVPFALAAFALARLLLRAARSVGMLLALPSRPRSTRTVARPVTFVAFSRRRGLALGYGTRGPPAPSV